MARCILLLLALLAVSASAHAQVDPLSTPFVGLAPNATSLNGPGNVFLTASLVHSGGSAFGAATSVAVADFNGDGKPDLAVADAGGNALSILLGNGDGTFQAPKDLAIVAGNNFTTYVAAGDFNGDGKVDLAVIDNSVPYVLLGNGDGTFTLKTTLPGFTDPQSVVLGDFNGDGKIDTAVIQGNYGSGNPSNVVVLLGNGDGTFQSPQTTSNFGAGAAILAAVADFNKDGKLDLVIADRNAGHVFVLLGNGNGTFQAARSFALASTAGGWDVAVGDFNGDGIPDIAATNASAGTVNILLGIGDGNFQAAVAFNAVPLGGYLTNLAAGDFNKDGKLDIITSVGYNGGGSRSTVAVLFGKGDGTLSAPLLLAANESPGQLALADFNGDGNLDWVAADTTQTSLTLGLGNGDGTFRTGVNYAVGATPQVAAGDFNKDGKLDLVTVDGGANDIRVLLGKGDGTFQPAITTAVSGAYFGIAVGDLNGDGNLDVVVSDSTGLPPRNLIVLLGKGDGTFAAPTRISSGGSSEGQIVVADFNGDGKLDIAVVNQSDNTVSLLLGNGNGTFQAPKITPALATDGFLGFLVAADLNGDGKLDFVVPDYVGSASGQVAILLGNGDGTFQTPTFLTSAGGSTGLAIADVNKDGKLDLVVANQFGTVDVFLGNGNGTFNTPIVVADNTQPMAGVCCANPIPIVVAVGDFNLDGHLDLFVGAYRSNNGSVGNFVSEINFGSQLFLGNGDGTFAAAQDYMIGAQTNSLAVADFNGDGAPDVAAGDPGENFVSILLNQTPPPVNLSPKSLTFANQLVGTTSSAQTITVTNDAASPTTVTVSVSGDFAQANTCPVGPATLAPAANCTVSVTFKPTTTGTRNGTLAISYSLPGGPQNVTVTGTGVAPAVTLGMTSVAFGNQNVSTSSGPQMISLTNSGTATLSVASIAITGTNPSDFSQTNNCGSSVAVGAACDINVAFKPTTTGARNASVTITDNAAGSPQNVTLSGTGTAPGVNLSTSNLTFAGQLVTTSSSVQTITLTNSGTSTLNITSVALAGANAGDFSQSNTCGTSVAASANCMISVTFKPTATGSRGASVTITDDASGSPQNVGLAGTGTDFSIAAAPGGSTSATVSAGQGATYNLQVTPISGFNGAVTLSCTGAPSEATCSAPASVTPNGTTASTFTVSVSTTAPSAAVPAPPMASAWRPGNSELNTLMAALFLFAPALLLLPVGARRRSPLVKRALLALAIGLLLVVWTACGGGGGGVTKNPGTPTGTYTLTVTGTSSGVSHTASLSLTVK